MSKIAKLIRMTNAANDRDWEAEWDWDELKSLNDRYLKEELTRLKQSLEVATLQRDIDTIKGEIAKRAEIRQWERDEAKRRAEFEAEKKAKKATLHVVPTDDKGPTLQ